MGIPKKSFQVLKFSLLFLHTKNEYSQEKSLSLKIFTLVFIYNILTPKPFLKPLALSFNKVKTQALFCLAALWAEGACSVCGWLGLIHSRIASLESKVHVSYGSTYHSEHRRQNQEIVESFCEANFFNLKKRSLF